MKVSMNHTFCLSGFLTSFNTLPESSTLIKKAHEKVFIRKVSLSLTGNYDFLLNRKKAAASHQDGVQQETPTLHRTQQLYISAFTWSCFLSKNKNKTEINKYEWMSLCHPFDGSDRQPGPF